MMKRGHRSARFDCPPEAPRGRVHVDRWPTPVVGVVASVDATPAFPPHRFPPPLRGAHVTQTHRSSQRPDAPVRLDSDSARIGTSAFVNGHFPGAAG